MHSPCVLPVFRSPDDDALFLPSACPACGLPGPGWHRASVPAPAGRYPPERAAAAPPGRLRPPCPAAKDPAAGRPAAPGHRPFGPCRPAAGRRPVCPVRCPVAADPGSGLCPGSCRRRRHRRRPRCRLSGAWCRRSCTWPAGRQGSAAATVCSFRAPPCISAA